MGFGDEESVVDKAIVEIALSEIEIINDETGAPTVSVSADHPSIYPAFKLILDSVTW